MVKVVYVEKAKFSKWCSTLSYFATSGNLRVKSSITKMCRKVFKQNNKCTQRKETEKQEDKSPF